MWLLLYLFLIAVAFVRHPIVRNSEFLLKYIMRSILLFCGSTCAACSVCSSFSAVTYFSYPAAAAAPKLFTATASANVSGAAEPISTYFHFFCKQHKRNYTDCRFERSFLLRFYRYLDSEMLPQLYSGSINESKTKSSTSFTVNDTVDFIGQGYIEPNPGPIQFGFLNVQSAVRKAALVHDLISSFGLDMFALSETWIVGEDSDAVKQDIAPGGYLVLNTHRSGATASTRGGGLALIY